MTDFPPESPTTDDRLETDPRDRVAALPESSASARTRARNAGKRKGAGGTLLAEIRRLRWAAIAAGNIPEILQTDEAAFVYGDHSPSWLLKSTVPRSYPPGRTGKPGEPVWLYSQLKLHAEKHLDRRLDEIPRVRRLRRTG